MRFACLLFCLFIVALAYFENADWITLFIEYFYNAHAILMQIIEKM